MSYYIFILRDNVFVISQFRLWHGQVVYDIGKPDVADDSELSHTRLTLSIYMFCFPWSTINGVYNGGTRSLLVVV